MKTNLVSLIVAALCLHPLFALPPDAEALKAKRDAKVAEIDRIYATELEKFQKKAMADGNLAGANEIEKEIGRVVKDPFKAGSAPNLVGKWRWTLNGHPRKTLQREFTATHLIDEDGDKHPYEIADGKITITWGNGLWEKLTFDPSDPDTLTGANTAGTEMVYKRL